MNYASNRFESLRTSMFGGFKKNDVMEYVDFLLSEAEGIRTEANQYKAEQESRFKKIEEEKAMLEARLRQLEESASPEDANPDLTAALEQEKRKVEAYQQKEREREQEYKDLEAKISLYEQRSSVVFEVLTEAKVKADHVLDDAREKAADMLGEAQQDIYFQRKLTEKIIRKEIDDQINHFAQTKAKINDYLATVSDIQDGLERIYISMNKMAAGIPTSVQQLKELEENFIVDESLLKDEADNR